MTSLQLSPRCGGGQGRPPAWYIGGASRALSSGWRNRGMQSTPKAATVPPDGAAATSRDFSIGRSAAELLRYGRVVLGLQAFVFGIGMRSRQMFRGEVATALSSGALIVWASVSWTDGGGNGQPPQAWRRLENRVTSRANPPVVTCRLQSREFAQVDASARWFFSVQEPSRTGFVHSREPA
jgi:hypothetical protein